MKAIRQKACQNKACMLKAILLITIATIAVIAAVAAVAGQNITKNEASSAIEEARKTMQEMQQEGFSIMLINDTLLEAEQFYKAQAALEEAGANASYKLIFEKVEKIANIKEKAYRTRDELRAVAKRLEESNVTEAYPLYEEAKKAFNDERYDEALELIEKVHSKISEMQATRAKIAAIARAGYAGISGFFKKRWKEFFSVLFLLSLIFMFTRKSIFSFFINRKIASLELEKSILLDLIKKTQHEYFELGSIPEGIYNIRISKYSELIRDINRQIPLLIMAREKMMKAKRKEKAKK